MQFFSFSEIYEILIYKQEQRQNNELLKAYEASYSALRNISYSQFKEMVTKNTTTYPRLFDDDNTEEIESKVETYLDEFTWEEVT